MRIKTPPTSLIESESFTRAWARQTRFCNNFGMILPAVEKVGSMQVRGKSVPRRAKSSYPRRLDVGKTSQNSNTATGWAPLRQTSMAGGAERCPVPFSMLFVNNPG